MGLFTRNLSAAGLSSRNIVAIRNFGGFIVLALAVLLWDRSALSVRLRHLPLFFGSGVVSVLGFTLCYFRCQQVCSLAVSAILLYTSPVFVVLFSALLWKDPITKRKLSAMAAAFLGCTFVSGVWSGEAAVTGQGLALGIGSAFFYGLYSIFARYALAYYKPMTVTVYTFLFAGLGSLAAAEPAALAACLAQPKAALSALSLVVFSTVLPYILYTHGLVRMDSGRASIIASMEPVVASAVGIAAFGEPLTIALLLGLGCILAAVYILR